MFIIYIQKATRLVQKHYKSLDLDLDFLETCLIVAESTYLALVTTKM